MSAAGQQTPAELTQRQVLDLLVRDPAARGYALATIGGLALIFFVMFMNGSDLGGILVLVVGAAALILRWSAAPPLVLLIVAYFQVFPFGIPSLGPESPFEVRENHFRVAHAVLAMAVLVYLRSQYRVFGLVHQIMPFENALRRKGDAPTRRPTAHIRPDEIAWLIGTAGLIVLVAQCAWWLVNAVEFVPMENGVPFRWHNPSSVRAYRGPAAPGEFRPGQNRFFVLLGGLFFGTLLVRLVFGYWRLRTMSASEGAMVLADTSWAESHRERVRVEKWRVWGRRRAQEQAEAAEREESARQARAERLAQERRKRDRTRRH